MGNGATAQGTVNVSGGVGDPSSLTIDNGLAIGYYGHGILNVSGNTTVTSNGLVYFGLFNSGTGELNIKDGAVFTSNDIVYVGYNQTLINNKITVSGQGSKLNVTGTGALYVGHFGKGTMTIADSGAVVSDGKVILANGSNSEGKLVIGSAAPDPIIAAGTFTAPELEFGEGTADLTFRHSATGNDFYDFSTNILSLIPNGPHTITHLAGNTRLSGGNSGFSGSVTVSGGKLAVDGMLSASSSLAVNGGELLGKGTVTQSVVFTNGDLSNTTGDELTILGGATFDAGSSVNVHLAGAPSTNSLFTVIHDLNLAGTLNVYDAGGFTHGVYRIFDYHSNLNGEFDHVVGHGGVDSSALTVQYSVPNQVNLVSESLVDLTFWDGGDANKHNNNAIDGGDGTWDAINDNWTDVNGATNGPNRPVPSFVVFGTTGGTVTVDDSHGAISATGMQFANDGYTIEGDDITLAGGNGESIIRVGDNSTASANYKATISSDLIGTNKLIKSDAGTLVLDGAKSFTGAVEIRQGTLAYDTHDKTVNLSAPLTGSGKLVKQGTGSLNLSDASAFTGAMDINQGTLRLNLAQDMTSDKISGAGQLMLGGTGKFTLKNTTPQATSC